LSILTSIFGPHFVVDSFFLLLLIFPNSNPSQYLVINLFLPLGLLILVPPSGDLIMSIIPPCPESFYHWLVHVEGKFTRMMLFLFHRQGMIIIIISVRKLQITGTFEKGGSSRAEPKALRYDWNVCRFSSLPKIESWRYS
jgi:hypothetical protein